MEATKSTIGPKTFTYQDAYQSALQYFEGDDLAAKVWVSKYALKDSEGNIYEQNPDDMHRRIASEISRIEAKYPNPLPTQKVFDLIKKFRYINLHKTFKIFSLINSVRICQVQKLFIT